MSLPSLEVMQTLADNMMTMKLRGNALIDWIYAFGSREPLKLMWALCSDRKTLFTMHTLNPLEDITRVEAMPWSLFWRRAAADVRDRLNMQGRKCTKFVMSATEKNCFMTYLEELEALCDKICSVFDSGDIFNNVVLVRKRIEKVRNIIESTYKL